MSVEVSAQAVADQIRRFISEVTRAHGISDDVGACLAPIAAAIEELGRISDPHAGQAASLAARAADRARTVLHGDLPGYVQSGNEIIRRLQS